MAKTLSVRLQWWLVLCLQLIIGDVILMLIAAIHSLLLPGQYHSAWDTLSLSYGASLAWLIILNTMVAYSLYVWLLSRMTVVEFTFAGISNPIAGILMGLLLVGDEFTVYQYALMSLMILASLIAPLFNIYQRRKSK